MQASDDDGPDDFTQLDDPAFLDERARVRGLLEYEPENAIGRAELERLYAAMTGEFLRRARIAWATASEETAHMDDDLLKRMLAVNVLLEMPEEIPDGLEAELYAYRDRLQAEALST